MRLRYITTLLLLLAAVLHTAAQGLSDRYNRQHPVVVVCTEYPPYVALDANGQPAGSYVDDMRAATNRMGLPCQIIVKEWSEALKTFQEGRADLIFADIKSFDTLDFFVSVITDYHHESGDSVAEVHIVGKDRQLVEQIDDQLMRLRQLGELSTNHAVWQHGEGTEPGASPIAHYIAIAALLLSVVLGIIILLTKLRIRSTARHNVTLSKLIVQAQQMKRFYPSEDTQAARDLMPRYEAILCHPFLAIAIYDNNGRIIVHNEAMRKINDANIFSCRRPLYNAKGEVINYIVSKSLPKEAAI